MYDNKCGMTVYMFSVFVVMHLLLTSYHNLNYARCGRLTSHLQRECKVIV